MNVPEEQVLAGQAVYTKQALRAYDFVVLGVSSILHLGVSRDTNRRRTAAVSWNRSALTRQSLIL
jgi:hypothetical protein